MTTLAFGTSSVLIPDDLTWSDEFSWKPVAQSTERTLTGALVLQTAAKQGGRPITLSGDESSGWVARNVVEALYAAGEVPGQTMVLTLRGVAHNVVADQENGLITATPVVDYSDPLASDNYSVTLRFLKV